MYVFITGTSGRFLAHISAVDKSLGVNLQVMPIAAGGCYERHQTGWDRVVDTQRRNDLLANLHRKNIHHYKTYTCIWAHY